MKDEKGSLQDVLMGLSEAHQFLSTGTFPSVLPGLEVHDLGAIGIPITSTDAKRIIKKAIQAPYGRGEETIVDTDVRRVWQLAPSQFTLRNSSWEVALASVLKSIQHDFAIHDKVTAELYKLLVYEKGSFFKPHRDTEKIPGMFATLIVCLPSRHEGGSLIVEHDGRIQQVDFGGEDSEFQTNYAAFYADCRHEVKKVEAGYRICLVYNLAAAKKRQPKAPETSAEVAKVTEMLRKTFQAEEPLEKLAIPLKHQYTQTEFGPEKLKGADRAAANILFQAAQALDLQCFYGLLTLHQTGIPDYGSIDFEGYWGRRRSRWSDDRSPEVTTSAGAVFEEIFEEELTLESWRDATGQEAPFGQIPFEQDEILGVEEKANWPFEQQVSEATGNEGASMDRWYRLGAIVLWPRTKHFHVLASGGIKGALVAIERMFMENEDLANSKQAIDAANAILSKWRYNLRPYLRRTADSARMLWLLERLGDKTLALRFIGEVLPEHFNGSEGRALVALCTRIGWKTLVSPIRNFFANQQPKNHYVNLNQLATICEHLCCDPPTLTKERLAACKQFASEMMEAIARWDESPYSTNEYRGDEVGLSDFDDYMDTTRKKANRFDRLNANESNSEREKDAEVQTEEGQGEAIKHFKDEIEAQKLETRGDTRLGVVASIVRLLTRIGANEHLKKFFARVFANHRLYGLRAVLIPDVKTLYDVADTPSERKAFSQLLSHCVTELKAATKNPIEPPADWKREANLKCTCKDCKALGEFLRDPMKRVGRFPLAKTRRQHLHRQIDRQRIEVTHVTERLGSPQTLVYTKTQESYERLKKRFALDQEALTTLERLAAPKKTSALVKERKTISQKKKPRGK